MNLDGDNYFYLLAIEKLFVINILRDKTVTVFLDRLLAVKHNVVENRLTDSGILSVYIVDGVCLCFE